MNKNSDIKPNITAFKTKVLASGALAGALLGLGAAYLLVKKAENNNSQLDIPAAEGIKLGLGVLGLLRQVAQLSE